LLAKVFNSWQSSLWIDPIDVVLARSDWVSRDLFFNYFVLNNLLGFLMLLSEFCGIRLFCT